MSDSSIYSSILGLSSQWHISDAVLDRQSRCLQLNIMAKGGAEFSCPVCGGLAKRVGSHDGCWQHDDLLNMCFKISAVIPVTSCEICGINKICVPWERYGSDFRIME